MTIKDLKASNPVEIADFAYLGSNIKVDMQVLWYLFTVWRQVEQSDDTIFQITWEMLGSNRRIMTQTYGRRSKILKDGKKCYTYIIVNVDNLLIISKDPKFNMDKLLPNLGWNRITSAYLVFTWV